MLSACRNLREIKGEKFYDFGKVRETIDWLTDEIAGKKKNIVDKPIVLHIYSPTCPDLTLIDLPGITRIALQGSEQPKDIERITRERMAMVWDFRIGSFLLSMSCVVCL